MANSCVYAILSLLVAASHEVWSLEITAAKDIDHVTEGDTLHLQCHGDGPLQWVWQGERISGNSSIFQLMNNSLVIDRVSHDLVGEDKPYICTNGTHNSSIYIILENDDRSTDIQGIVIGCIIGVGGATVIIMLVMLAVFCTCYSKDKVSDMDHLNYTEYEEMEPRLNLEKIAQLDPAIRAKIDFQFLARLTNTDPSVIASLEYDNKQPSRSDRESVTVSGAGLSSSLGGSVRSLTPSLSLSQSVSLKPLPLATVASTTPLRRVNTVNDFNHCPPGPNRRVKEIKRRGSLANSHSTSQPTIEQCMLSTDEEDLKAGVLQILSLVQESKKQHEQPTININLN